MTTKFEITVERAQELTPEQIAAAEAWIKDFVDAVFKSEEEGQDPFPAEIRQIAIRRVK